MRKESYNCATVTPVIDYFPVLLFLSLKVKILVLTEKKEGMEGKKKKNVKKYG